MSRIQNETEIRDSNLFKETEMVRDISMVESSKDGLNNSKDNSIPSARKETLGKLEVWLGNCLDESEVKIAMDRLDKMQPMRKQRIFDVFTKLRWCMFDPNRIKAIVPVTNEMDLKKSIIQQRLQAGMKNQHTHKHLPQAVKDKLTRQDQILNEVIDQHDMEYLGTDPLCDA